MDKFLHILYCVSPIISILVSSALSYIIATNKAKTEIQKISLRFEHEDNQAFQASLADILAKSGMYINTLSKDVFNSTVSSCSVFTALCPERFVDTAIKLDNAILNRNIKEIEEARITLIQINSNKV